MRYYLSKSEKSRDAWKRQNGISKEAFSHTSIKNTVYGLPTLWHRTTCAVSFLWRPPRARAPSLNSHTVVSSMIEYCKQVDAQTNSSRLPRTMQIFTFVATLLYRHFGLWWGRQLRRRCDGKTLSPLGLHHPRLCFGASPRPPRYARSRPGLLLLQQHCCCRQARHCFGSCRASLHPGLGHSSREWNSRHYLR